MGKILKSFDLIRYFPTEKSRYSAYVKFFVISLIFIAVFIGFDALLRYYSGFIIFPDGEKIHIQELINTHGKFLEPQIIKNSEFELMINNTIFQIISNIFYLGSLIIMLLIFYVSIYLFVKSGCLKFILKLLFMVFLSIILYFLSIRIFPPIALVFPIIALIGLRKRRERLRQYKNYIKYSVYPQIFLIIVSFTLFISHFILSLAYHSSNRAISNLNTIYEFLAIVTIISIFIVPLYFYRKLVIIEEKSGRPFLQMYKLSFTVQILYCLMIFSVINLLPGHFFNADSLIDDLSVDIDDNFNILTPNNNTAAFENIDTVYFTESDQTMDIIDNNTEYTDNFYSNTTESSNAFDSSPNGIETLSFNSLNFNGISFNTPMHTEAFQENPYTLFALNSPEHGTALDFCSNDGMPQLHITADGQMLNSELSPIGKIVYGDNGTMTMFNNNNIEMASVDNHGFVKSGDYILGKVQNNGDLRTFTDFQNNESSYVQNGTIWANGKMVGQIKKV